jgi:peptidoglycan/LPS O-acetylase OafA/YrhL
MFGSYRFLLAILVALSHFGIQAGGFNPGQWAVISFYVLSGLLMERQFHKLSPRGKEFGGFYLDRFLRVYPLFVVVLLLVWTQTHLAWSEAVENVALLPLNYHDFSGVRVLISPSWSLACEAHFYLLVPLLAVCSTKTLRIVAGGSLGLFAVSPLLPHAGFWAYVGLPGILFTFVTGILINREDVFFRKMLGLVMVGLLAGFIATKLAHAGLPTGIHINVAIGYLVAAVVVPRLDQLPANLKWDKYLGLFAFPLFLCHGPLAEFIESHWRVSHAFVLLFWSVLLSLLLILTVEIPFDLIRYRIRAASKRREISKAKEAAASGIAPGSL